MRVPLQHPLQQKRGRALPLENVLSCCQEVAPLPYYLVQHSAFPQRAPHPRVAKADQLRGLTKRAPARKRAKNPPPKPPSGAPAGPQAGWWCAPRVFSAAPQPAPFSPAARRRTARQHVDCLCTHSMTFNGVMCDAPGAPRGCAGGSRTRRPRHGGWGDRPGRHTRS